jgi:hypothetical protein
LNAAQLDEVRRAIEQAYPSKKILLQNSFDKQNIEQWIEWFNKTFSFDRKSLDIDYNIYGEGEAKLAWLDAVLDIKTKKMSAAKAASVFAEVMYQNIAAQKLIIGHLKYLINDGKNNFKINYTTTSKEQKIFLVDSTSIKASIIVNARVQTTPEILQQILQDSIAEAALQTNSEIKIKSLSAFKPGFPRPTYRIAN